MTIVTQPRWDALLIPQSEPCLSLYMPAPRGGPETRQSPVRFRNLLAQAHEQAQSHGLSLAEAAMVEAEALGADRDFWQRQRGGLALFVGRDVMDVVLGPYAFVERVEVGRDFCLTPLMALPDASRSFHLLSLSQHCVRLHALDRDTISSVALPGLPGTLEDVVGWDYQERSLQFHTRSTHARMQVPASGATRRRAMYFGHGDNADQDKDEVMRFCRRVDEALLAALPEPLPELMLGAVEYVAAIYRHISRYPRLLPQVIVGNCDHLSEQELHLKAWRNMDKQRDADQARLAQQLREQIASKSMATDLFEIIAAAQDGRVAALYLSGNGPIWGHFSPSQRTGERHFAYQKGDEDLLNFAVTLAMRSGANVHALGADVLGDHRMAAQYRY